MGLIDSGSKSNRLLASRRYTHNTFTTAQESFTNVLDLRAEEIYTQASKIPSSGLPFSGSSQNGSIHTDGDDNILKYYFRQKLTKSNVNNEVWFFLNPPGSNSGIDAQLIDDNQQTNFISPKYSVVSLANANTEDNTPGYGVKVFKSTSTDSGSLGSDAIVSSNDYQFDYKTGVLQFLNSSVDPTDSQYVYMTAYQYVGKTLATRLELDGGVSGSATSTGSFGRVEATSFSGDGSGLTNVFEGTVPSASISTRLTNLSSDSASFSTRITVAETELEETIVSASAQLAEEISGSFSAPSASFSTRITNLKTDSGSFSTRVTDLKSDSGSFSTRVTNLKTDSGSFSTRITNLKSDSGSFSTRTTDLESKVGQSLNITDSPVFDGLRVTGDVHAERYIVSSSVSIITSSFSSGSTIFGDTMDDTHTFTGSLKVTGSVTALNLTADSSSFSTRITDLKTDSGSLSTRITADSSSFSTRITNLKTDSGSFSTRVTNLKTDSGSFSTRTTNLENASASFSTRITTAENELENTIISASAQLSEEISGSFTAPSASFSTRLTNLKTDSGSFSTRITADSSSFSTRTTNLENASASFSTRITEAETELENTIVSASAQLSEEISGSFTAPSASFSTRITNLVSDSASFSTRITVAETELEETIISASAQLSEEISGSFTAPSASFSTRITNLVSDSASFSTRITVAEGELENTLLSASAQLAEEISGSFTAPSASISERLTTAESELSNTLISGSAQIASNISGAFSVASASFASDINNLQSDSASFSTRVTNLKTDSGSFSTRITADSSSLATRITNFSTGNVELISGSATSTGSFGRVEITSGKVLGDSTSAVSVPFSIVGGTSAAAGGLQFGAYDANFGGIWPASVTPAASNYSFVARNGRTVLNTTTDIGLYKDDATVLLFANSTGVAIGGDSLNPGYKLDVIGTGRFTGNLTLGGNVVGDDATNISGVNDITALGDISGSATSTGSFGQINTAGNVGLGITNVGMTDPSGGSRTLHIHKEGSDSAAALRFTTGDTGTALQDGLVLEYWDGAAYLWNYENTSLGFATNNTTRMTIAAGGDVTMNNGLIVTNNITANGNIVGDNSTNISQVNNITATSFTGIFNGALSGSAQIASDISGAFALASASFAADILSNSSSFAARDTLSEATSSKILNGQLEFTNITGSGHISMSLSSTGSFGKLETTAIGGHSPLLIDSNTTFENQITASSDVKFDNKVFINNIFTSSVDSQMDLQGKVFVHTGSIVGDLHIRTNEDVMRFGKSTSGLIVSASENISRFATGSDGSIIDLGFTIVDEDGNTVLAGAGDGIHVDDNNYWYNNKFYKIGDGVDKFLEFNNEDLKYKGQVFAQTGSIDGELYITTGVSGSMFIGKYTGGLPTSGSGTISRFATGSDGSIIDLGFTTTDEDGNSILLTTGDGIHLDSANYWYTTGHFKLGNSNNFINWDTSNLTVSGTFTGDGSGLTGIGASSVPTNTVSSSAQLASDISGSFTALSASLASRIAAEEAEVGSVPTDTVSGSAQLAVSISGSFVQPSSSFSTRVTSLEANPVFSSADISGSFVELSASLSNRIATGGITLPTNTVSSSAQISANISGSFTELSASLANRIATGGITLPTNTVSSSAQLASDISGSFVQLSSSLGTRVTTLETGGVTIPTNTVSSSAQITAGLPSGVISGSSAGLTILGDGKVGINNTTPQLKLDVSNGASGIAAHFGGSISTTNGVIGGVSFGYFESNNANYRKAGIIQEQIGDSHARGDLHLIVNTQGGQLSATAADARLTIDGLTGDVLFPVANQKISGSLTSTGSFGRGIIDGDLTVDTDTLHVDSTNNRVGVGTTSPGVALEVVGSISGSASSTGSFGHVVITSPGDALELRSSGPVNTAGNTVGIDFTTNIYPTAGRNAYIDASQDSSNRGKLTIGAYGTVGGSTTFYDILQIHAQDGNAVISGSSISTGSFGAGYIDNKLGIGTTSPDSLLHTKATGAANTLKIESTTSYAQLLLTGGGSVNYINSDDKLSLYVGSDRLTINSTEAVFPTANYKISGSSTSTGSFGRLEIASTGSFGHIIGDGTGITNVTSTVPTGTVSGSAQITAGLPSGVISGSNGNITASLNISAVTGSISNIQTPLTGRVISNFTELIKVTVVSDGGNHYAFEGATAPSIQVSEGKTYRFDISDSTVGAHPFRFSTTEDGSHNGGSAYTTGVTVVGTQGQAGAYVEIQITKGTANALYYYCTSHPGMGNDGRLLKNDLMNLAAIKVTGNQVDFTNLPTSNPNVAGRLWNDSGTVKISSG